MPKEKAGNVVAVGDTVVVEFVNSYTKNPVPGLAKTGLGIAFGAGLVGLLVTAGVVLLVIRRKLS